MGSSTSAELYVGVLLTEKKVMKLFGADYEDRIYEECPDDNTPNPDKNNFCGKCGKDLKYKEKVSDGIEHMEEVEDMLAVKKSGLDIEQLSEEGNGIEGIILGTRFIESKDLDYGGDVSEINIKKLESTIAKIQKKVTKIGIKEPVKAYFVTYVG